ARPIVGPAVRFAKRVVRRGLRWYVKPIMEQQSRFNHAVLDLTERVRLSYEKLVGAEADATRERIDELDAALDRLRADVDAPARPPPTRGCGPRPGWPSSTGPSRTATGARSATSRSSCGSISRGSGAAGGCSTWAVGGASS